MTILTILLHILITALFARAEARNDYIDITNGKYIDHKRSWLYRAGIMGMASTFVGMVFHLPFHWTVILGFAMMSAFGFSAIFRHRLNKLRTLSPYYISSSNWYDTFFLLVVNIGTVEAEEYNINGAGRLAYITECTLFAIGIVLVALNTAA